MMSETVEEAAEVNDLSPQDLLVLILLMKRCWLLDRIDSRFE